MRFLIVGAGGLGTVLAAFLARSGAEVSLLIKPEQAVRFERPEVRVQGAADFSAPVSLVSRPSLLGSLGSYEYALLCVKARDSEAALAALADARFESALSLQNGVGKDELLVARLGADRVLGAVTYVAGAALGPGLALASNPAATFVGELDGRPSARVETLVRAIEAAGLPATAASNIVTLEWYKLAIFLRTALVSALTRLDIARLAAQPALCRVCAAAAREVCAVAAAEGHPLPRHASDEFSLAGPAPPGASDMALDAAEDAFAQTLASLGRALRAQGRTFYPSLAQDIMAARPTELGATAGDILTRARRDGIAVPTLSACTDLLRGIERHSHGDPPPA